MAFSRLLLYNAALRLCGERRLASLTEDREPRHLLDGIWAEGLIDDVLEQGQWNFAMRSIRIDYDPGIQPDFGYRRAFLKPDDWIRTCGLCADEYFREPLLQYFDEPDYWYADLDTLYIRYVSNDSGYGADLSRWPGTFCDYAAAHAASKIVTKLTQDKDRIGMIDTVMKRAKRDALNKDAMNEPSKHPAPGSWVRARRGWGRGGPLGDGGSTGSLTG